MGKSKSTARLVAAGVAVAMALSTAAPGWSAPVMSSAAALKLAIPSTTAVQWRPAYGWAIAGAAAVGVIAGATLARPYRYYGYYGPPPAYAAPPPPAYVVPPPVYAGPPPDAPPPRYYSYRNQADPAGCGPGTHAC